MDIKNKNLDHLKNYGEMGARIAAFDWSKTALGSSDQWPQNLLFTINLMLENKIAQWIVWGPELIQIYNDQYAHILAKKHPAALGAPAKKTWKEIWGFVDPLMQKVFSGEAIQFDNQALDVETSGKLETRYYTFCYSPIRNSDFTIGGALNTVTDTTNENKYRQALYDSEKKFKNLLDEATLPFFSVRPDWIVDYMNPSGTTILDMKIEDILNRKLWDIYPGLEESVFGDSYKKAMYEKERVSFIGYYPNFDRWYQVNAYPYQDGIGVSFLDITSGKKLEDKLNEAVIVRDDFLSISSHELNTPLTSLKIQTQLINRDIHNHNPKAFDQERVVKFAEHADKQVTRMTRLIEDMLDVARIRSGKLSIKKEKMDFVKFLKDIIHRLEPIFKGHNLEEPPVEVINGDEAIGEFDSMRIEQVINNLTSNSIRYGEGKPVSVKLQCYDKKVIFCIQDNGLGIEKKNQELIFNRFERVSDKRQTKGLGLGLYISNQIVNAHGGRMYVESEIGKGSTFFVELPI